MRILFQAVLFNLKKSFELIIIFIFHYFLHFETEY